MAFKNKKITHKDYHRFLDEAGDLTFFKKGGEFAVGTEGISKMFSIGMVYLKEELDVVRDKIKNLVYEIEHDSYLNKIPSIKKRIGRGGFYFHAKDDPPEVRERFFKLMAETDFSLEIYVARKRQDIFINKHKSKQDEFYADILSHLLKNKFDKYTRLVLNIAQRGTSTSGVNLEKSKKMALEKSKLNGPKKCTIVFNVQSFDSEPILSIVDYASWAVQRVFETGEVRFYEFIKDKIPVVADIYDYKKYRQGRNFYGPKNPLSSKNKI